MPAEIIKIEDAEIINPENPEKLFQEINLIRIEGCYFSFSRKHKKVDPKNHIETYEYKIPSPEGEVTFSLKIDIHPSYGKPGVTAYKVFTAILKKINDYSFPFPNGVPLGYRELCNLAGRAVSGRAAQQIVKAIKQLRRTGIECEFAFKPDPEKNSKIYRKIDLEIISKVIFSGVEHENKNRLTQIYLEFHPDIIANLNNRYWCCLNYDHLKQLEPLAQALYKKLFFHFSNIYDRRKAKQFVFTKDYKNICKYWLGGLATKKYKSKIQEQLGPHVEKIKKTKIIRSFKIEKNAKGNGYNLVFRPGAAFFENYKRFYGSFPQMVLPFKAESDRRLFYQPMGLVSYFYKKLLKTDDVEDEILDQSEVDFAGSLLAEYSYEEIIEWIDYAISEAEKTGFKMKKMAGIKNFKTEFFISKKKHVKRTKENKFAEQKALEESFKFKYDAYVRNMREQFEQAASKDPKQKNELEALKQSLFDQALKKRGKKVFAKMDSRFDYNKIIDERAGVLSFDQWKNQIGK